MKRKLFLIVLVVFICITALFIYSSRKTAKGDTIESREYLLNVAISKGKDWTIAKELALDGYIISGAYSADGKATLAVFEPMGTGSYKFRTSRNETQEDIIISREAINGSWYDLIWFCGAQTAYAEITYTVNGQTQEPLRFPTADMDIIHCKNPEKEYSIQVFYYDSDGNRYG